MVKIKIDNLKWISFFLYLIAISAYQLGTGFDAIFVRVAFTVFIGISILTNRKIIVTSHLKWLLMFWGWYFLSVLWASDMNYTLNCFNIAIQVIGTSLILPTMIKDKNDIDKVFKLVLFSIFYSTSLVLIRTPIQYLGTDRLGEVIGLHSNDFGARLSVAFIISLYLFKTYSSSKSKKIIFGSSIVLFALVTLLTGSRRSLGILALGYISFEWITSNGLQRLKKIFVIALALSVFIYIIFNNELFYSVIGYRIEIFISSLSESNTSTMQDGSLRERLFFAQSAFELWVDNIIFGYGGNNFRAYMSQIHYKHVTYSHNNYLEMLSTLGIIGAGLYYGYLYTLLFKAVKVMIKYKNDLSVLLTIILILYLGTDIMSISYISDFTQIMFCISSIVIYKKINIYEYNLIERKG